MGWDRSLKIFKIDLTKYLSTTPDELLDLVREHINSHDFSMEVYYAMGCPSGHKNYKNGKFEFLNFPVPTLTRSFTWKFDSKLDGRDIFFIRVIEIKHKPTFEAELEVGVSIDILLSYWANRKQMHPIVLKTKIPIFIDLSFSDEINNLYFDYLSDI